MTIPMFTDKIEDSRKIPLAVLLWYELRSGRDREEVLAEVEAMDEPEFYKFMKKIK